MLVLSTNTLTMPRNWREIVSWRYRASWDSSDTCAMKMEGLRAGMGGASLINVGICFRDLQLDEVTRLCGEVNDLIGRIGRRFSEAVPIANSRRLAYFKWTRGRRG